MIVPRSIHDIEEQPEKGEKMNKNELAVVLLLGLLTTTAAVAWADQDPLPTVAIIGTGDMGDSLGPRFAELGYPVVYGSRSPDGEKAQNVVKRTGENARVTTQKEAAQAGDIVVLVVPWPAMETVAQNIGSLDGKIVIDPSMPSDAGEDGYFVPLVETSSAEMIQSWHPGARVVKAFATLGSFVIDNPDVVGGPVTVPIAADDRAAKEEVGRMVAAMGLDSVDGGPLRFARELEALQRLYMVPLIQGRRAAWEIYNRRSYYWECLYPSAEWYQPVSDADNLAQLPETQGPARACPGT
jgi:predicted dinucleotide-binding enzyme